MPSRSLTVIEDKEDELVVMYRQMDGYPNWARQRAGRLSQRVRLGARLHARATDRHSKTQGDKRYGLSRGPKEKPSPGFLAQATAILNRNSSASRQTWIVVNTADDFINPRELGTMERVIKRVKRGRYVLLPLTERGHGSVGDPSPWKEYLRELLEPSAR